MPPELPTALRTTSLAVGALDVRELGGRPFGLLMVEGLLLRELLMADASAAELLGPGDRTALRRPADEAIPTGTRWTVVAPSRVLLLDQEALSELTSRPALARQFASRSFDQVERMAVHRAIVQLPRVEQRVLGLLWLLAQRWGRVSGDGVLVPIGLTHATLGRLVGAQRPTVSLALKALAADGAVHRRTDGTWVLHPDSARDHLGTRSLPAPVPAPEPTEPVVTETPQPLRRMEIDVEALRQRVEHLRDTASHRVDVSRDLLETVQRTHDETRVRRARLRPR